MSSVQFYQAKLDNGLTIVGEYRPSAVSISTGFFVRTGARDETPKLSGVSHFLEHMIFKGTEKRSALDITYQLSALGAQSNAFTTEENTVYYVSVLPEYFSSAFEILSDMMRPALDQGEFATEKKVILEEIALYQDRPAHVLYESAVREFFGVHGGGNSVLGSIESITNLTVDQMRDYFSERYTAPNIVLGVSGKFQWTEVVDLANRYCAHWPSHRTERTFRELVVSPREIEIRRDNLQLAHLCLLSPGPAADDSHRYAVQLLACIIGDGHGSRAFWELVDKGIADTASVDSDEMDKAGFIMAYASALPENIGIVEETLLGIIRTPRDFSPEQFERARTKLKTRLVLQGESSMRRLMSVGLDWLYTESYTSLEDELHELTAVKEKHIEEALQRFPFAPTTTARLLPN